MGEKPRGEMGMSFSVGPDGSSPGKSVEAPKPQLPEGGKFIDRAMQRIKAEIAAEKAAAAAKAAEAKQGLDQAKISPKKVNTEKVTYTKPPLVDGVELTEKGWDVKKADVPPSQEKSVPDVVTEQKVVSEPEEKLAVEKPAGQPEAAPKLEAKKVQAGPREVAFLQSWAKGKPVPPDVKAYKYTATCVDIDASGSPKFEGLPFVLTKDKIPDITLETRKSSVRSKDTTNVNYDLVIPPGALKKGDRIEVVRLVEVYDDGGDKKIGGPWGGNQGIAEVTNVRTGRSAGNDAWESMEKERERQYKEVIEKM